MTQPLDIINGSLLDIGARAPGETAPPEDVNEAFTLLNQLLDSLSNESMFVFYKQEIIHEITPGTYQYLVGPNGIGCSFNGSISGNILTVTSITSGAISVGQIINGSGAVIQGLGTGLGGNGTSALGTYFLNISTSSSGPYTSYIQRPLRVNSAFVRVFNSVSGTLDFPVVPINIELYEKIGIKTLPGPWPRAVYYQPSAPNAMLTYWPNPSQGEMHLICDGILNRYTTINDTINLPPGMELALRRLLAVDLMPSYGTKDPSVVQLIMQRAKEARGVIKKTNMAPQQTATFDSVLMSKRINDASFILHGGFS